jgi:hypothetical protein
LADISFIKSALAQGNGTAGLFIQFCNHRLDTWQGGFLAGLAINGKIRKNGGRQRT